MNVFNKFKESCNKHGNKEALTIRMDDGTYRRYTYAELLAKTENYASTLTKAGILKGDRIVLVAENSPEWVIAFFAVVSLEATAVLLDPSLASVELMSFIKKSDVRGSMLSPKVREKLFNIGELELPTFDILNEGLTFEGDCTKVKEGYSPTPDPNSEIITIIYSSGTTSTAKGVMHGHEGIGIMAEKNIEYYELDEKERQLGVIPLYHIYGFMSKMICTMISGGTTCFIESMTSENLNKAFEEFKPTSFACVPRVFDMFKNKIRDTIQSKGKIASGIFNFLFKICLSIRIKFGINLGKYIFKSVHKAFGGEIHGLMSAGSTLDDDTFLFFYGLGLYIFNNYGITETNIPITANYYKYKTIKTSGKPFKGIHVKVKEDSGEILVKTPGIMKGYFRDEETTKSAFNEEGWFYTGDIGYLETAGNLIITGRLKENIVLATGKKVSPFDIENIYGGVVGISELVVCGISMNNGVFDEIHGFIVVEKNCSRENSEIQGDIFNISSSLPQQMRIAKIHFVKEIPKTSLQKPKRYLLKELVLNENLAIAEVAASTDTEDVGSGYFGAIIKVVTKLNFSKNAITKNSRLIEDLGFDSLTITEFCLLLQKDVGRDIFCLIKPNITIGELEAELDKEERPSYVNHDYIPKFPFKKGFLGKAILSIAAVVTKFFYKIEVRGLNNLPDGKGYLLCPNHETNFDALWILMFLPREQYLRFCCMGKMETLHNPLGKLMMRIGGGIPVDRHGNPGPALKRCLDKLNEGCIVLVHPEGTRTKDGKMGEFKKGASKLAIDSKLPIIPVKIGGGYDIYPRSRIIPRLFNISNMSRYRLCISFGEPILANNYDAETLTMELKNRILKL